MKELCLTKGQSALLDDEDHEWASRWKWCINNTGYAVRRGVIGGKVKLVLLHRELLERKNNAPIPNGAYCDHINRNKLDNRRANLRLADRSLNMSNVPARSRSGIRGVSYDAKRKKWFASITFQRKMYALGRYDTSQEAHEAFCRKYEELRGHSYYHDEVV